MDTTAHKHHQLLLRDEVCRPSATLGHTGQRQRCKELEDTCKVSWYGLVGKGITDDGK